MNLWKSAVAVASLVQLAFGVFTLFGYSFWTGIFLARQAGWEYVALGLAGAVTLAVPRAGYFVAVGQALAAGHFLLMCWGIYQVTLGPPILPLGVAEMVFTIGGATVSVGVISAVGCWQVAYLRPRRVGVLDEA